MPLIGSILIKRRKGCGDAGDEESEMVCKVKGSRLTCYLELGIDLGKGIPEEKNEY
jgi:hypothetical protein